jgi:hypothetical protein
MEARDPSGALGYLEHRLFVRDSSRSVELASPGQETVLAVIEKVDSQAVAKILGTGRRGRPRGRYARVGGGRPVDMRDGEECRADEADSNNCNPWSAPSYPSALQSEVTSPNRLIYLV